MLRAYGCSSSSPGVSIIAAICSSGWVAEHDRQLPADHALADLGVAVALGAEVDRGVVHVQAGEALHAEALVDLGHERVDPPGVGDIDAGRPQVAGVQAHGHALGPADRVEHLLDLVQAHAHRPARAGRIFDHELRRRPGSSVGEHAHERVCHLRHDGVEAAAEMAAEVEDDALGVDRLRRSHRVVQRTDDFSYSSGSDAPRLIR